MDADDAVMLPEGLDETLHFLGLSLHPDVGLELPQRIVQFHAGEVHLIHHAAAETSQNKVTEGKNCQSQKLFLGNVTPRCLL